MAAVKLWEALKFQKPRDSIKIDKRSNGNYDGPNIPHGGFDMRADADTPQTESAGIQFAGPDDARLVFSGPPQRLTGTIPLINTSSDKQKLRRLEVSADVLKGPAQLPLEEVPFLVKLSPGQQAAVAGVISLDEGTPAGTYEMEVKVGDRTVPATVHVTEVVDLFVEPTDVTILAGAAQSYTRKFIVENRGNTKLPLGDRCEAPIFDSFDLASSLVIGLHKADKSSLREMVKSFLTEWGDLLAGTLVIKREAMILRPGQRVVMEAEFEIPAELKPFHHYFSNVQLYNAFLNVDIYTTKKVGSENGPKTQSARRRKDG